MYVLANILKIYYFYSSTSIYYLEIEAYDISFQSVSIFLTPEG